MRIILFVLVSLFSLNLFAQSDYQMKGNEKEIDANFLFGYYQQDGDNAAVTGGVGTEELQDFASLIVVNLPLDTINAISINLGADFYTSASTDNIDDNVSSASSKDLRTYGNLGYSRKNLGRGETYGLGLGFSTEYDYNSISGRISYTKEWNKGNSEINVNGQAFFDSWDLIYPREIRNEVKGTVASSKRQSYNFQATYSQVLNKRLQMSISGEAIYMTGFLSTPFHRVYFAEQNRLDIERLPDSRLKIPIGLRLNYFPADNVVLRSYYRFYWDDFGISAHTASLEVPVKVGTAFTVYPFYRYHTQSASDYFAPISTHSIDETFYTSDYDLSELTSQNIGLGFTYAPLYGVARFKLSRKLFMLDKINIRSSYYTRSTGLKGFSASLDLSFKIKSY